MAFANFGILQAMPDPYERIRQASQGWGALPGVVGGIQNKMEQDRIAREQAYNQQKKAEITQRILGEWDSKEDGEIFKAGDTEPVRFRRAAMLLSPYDPKLSESMLMQADERDRFEKQLLDQTARAEANEPNEIFIRAEKGNEYAQQRAEKARQEFEIYSQQRSTDTAGVEAKRQEYARAKAQADTAYAKLKELAKGTKWASVYSDAVVAPPAGNAPVVEAPAVEAPAAFSLPKMTKSSDAVSLLGMVDDALINQQISPADAGQLKTKITNEANARKIKENELAGTQKSAETLAQNALKDSGYNAQYDLRTDYNAAAQETENLLANVDGATDADINSLAKMVAFMEGGRARPGDTEAKVKEENKVRDILSGIGFKLGATAEEKRAYLNSMRKRVNAWKNAYDTTYRSALDAVGEDKTARSILEKKYKGAGLWSPSKKVDEPAKPRRKATAGDF